MDKGNAKITLAGIATAEIEEKKSVFIGSASPVTDEESARSFIESVKKKYYDARHNVFAYLLDGGNISRYSDDGEPKGSAGIPMLNVLKMSGACDLCVVVTRYFGGILLGAGGLARAYSAAAKAAIDAAGFVTLRTFAILRIVCSYSDYQKISSKLSSAGATEDFADFGENVTMTVSVLKESASAVEYLVTQLTNGKCSAVTVGYEERGDNASPKPF